MVKLTKSEELFMNDCTKMLSSRKACLKSDLMLLRPGKAHPELVNMFCYIPLGSDNIKILVAFLSLILHSVVTNTVGHYLNLHFIYYI